MGTEIQFQFPTLWPAVDSKCLHKIKRVCTSWQMPFVLCNKMCTTVTTNYIFLRKYTKRPCLAWLSWLGVVLCIEGSIVRFLVRAQVMGLIPTCFSLFFPSSLMKIYKNIFFLKKENTQSNNALQKERRDSFLHFIS